MQRKIFCLYSGGIKSIASLWYILSNPKYQDYLIHIHYIDIINYQSKSHNPREMLEIIIKHFPREFVISNNQINFSCLPASSLLPNDLDICAFVSSQYISLNADVKYILLGQNITDDVKSVELKRFQLALDMAKKLPSAPPDIELLLPLKNLSYPQLKALIPKKIGLQLKI